MAGTHHHLIPRQFLRGFASCAGRQDALTWVFARGKEPKERGVDTISVVKHFHGGGGPGETNADPIVTEFENRKVASWVHGWRQLTCNTIISPDGPAQLVAHFMVRGKPLRDNFTAASNILLSEVGDGLFKDNNLERLVLAELKTNPEGVKEQILAALPPNLSVEMAAGISELVQSLMPQMLKEFVPEVRGTIENALTKSKEDLPMKVRESHNRTLAQSPVPALRVADLQSLTWSIEVFDKGTLILGDVGPVAQIIGTEPFKTFIDKDEVVSQVLFPLASTHLLVGRHKDLPRVPVDAEQVNHASVRCSTEYFVASKRTEREERYCGLFGEWAEMFPEPDIRQIAADALAERLSQAD